MGEIREFASGARRNNAKGKGRYDLISPAGLRRLAIRYEEGATAHGERNWEKGIPMSSLLDSAARHIYEYLDGKRNEDHLAAAAWNIFAAMHFESAELARGEKSSDRS